MGLGEVSVADQEATDDFNIGMNQRREAIERSRRFEMITIPGAGAGEKGVTLIGLEGDGLGQGKVAESAVEFSAGPFG